MKITVIIPNYNGEKFLKNCINSLNYQTFKNFNIIVIDNNSSDNSINILKNYPSIKIIRNPKNYGFSKAVNIGIKNSNSKYIILLNNDTIVDKNFIQELFNEIEKNKDIFSVQAKILNINNKLIDSAGDIYTIFGIYKSLGNNKKTTFKHKNIFSSCACAAIYKKNILENIGYFDENFFAYLEDIDICFRAKLFGFKNVIANKAICYHSKSATTGSIHNKFKVYLSARNFIYLNYKNMPILLLLLNLLPLFIGIIIKSIYFTKKHLFKSYITGIINGLKTIKNINKIKYTNNRFKYYLKTEKELFLNTFKLLK